MQCGPGYQGFLGTQAQGAVDENLTKLDETGWVGWGLARLWVNLKGEGLGARDPALLTIFWYPGAGQGRQKPHQIKQNQWESKGMCLLWNSPIVCATKCCRSNIIKRFWAPGDEARFSEGERRETGGVANKAYGMRL